MRLFRRRSLSVSPSLRSHAGATSSRQTLIAPNQRPRCSFALSQYKSTVSHYSRLNPSVYDNTFSLHSVFEKSLNANESHCSTFPVSFSRLFDCVRPAHFAMAIGIRCLRFDRFTYCLLSSLHEFNTHLSILPAKCSGTVRDPQSLILVALSSAQMSCAHRRLFCGVALLCLCKCFSLSFLSVCRSLFYFRSHIARYTYAMYNVRSRNFCESIKFQLIFTPSWSLATAAITSASKRI